MTAYYNEFDPFAADWLEELIKAKVIAPGVVDRRSIVDVKPAELLEFTQCHFFAGIGVWSYALRLAGWPDDRPIWTGSCPCQPFSGAGQGGGFDDERHLWPHFHWLIQNNRPAIVVGEQVASKDGLHWLDLVQADLEGTSYTSGAIDTCSAGVGAPHQRQRLYWMAYSDDFQSRQGRDGGIAIRQGLWSESSRCGSIGDLAYATCEFDNGSRDGRESRGIKYSNCRPTDIVVHTERARLEGFRGNGDRIDQSGRFYSEQDRSVAATSSFSGLEHAESYGRFEWWPESSERSIICRCSDDETGSTGPLNGFWRNADWLFCRDEQWRAVEPGTFPLASGVADRVGLLRGYGNAINAYQAKVFIETVNEILDELA